MDSCDSHGRSTSIGQEPENMQDDGHPFCSPLSLSYPMKTQSKNTLLSQIGHVIFNSLVSFLCAFAAL